MITERKLVIDDIVVLYDKKFRAKAYKRNDRSMFHKTPRWLRLTGQAYGKDSGLDLLPATWEDLKPGSVIIVLDRGR